jgi:hypothetical protein
MGVVCENTIGPDSFLFPLSRLDKNNTMSEEKILALFDALKQIHATALELFDNPDLPEQVKKSVVMILEEAETALNAQNKEPPDTPDD